MDAPHSIETTQPLRLHVIRYLYSAHSAIGKLSIDGVYFSVTLENVQRLIPEGSYPCKVRYSPHNGCDVIGVDGIPGRTDIEIHPANKPEELLGCIAVGETQAPDFIGNSRMMFNRLMEIFREPAILTVESSTTEHSGGVA